MWWCSDSPITPMMTLYHCVSARSFRPLWALEALGPPYELHMLPFPPRELKREYLEANPLGTVPLLIDGPVRMGQQALDLEKAEVVKLPGIKEAGTGAANEDERKELKEIVAKMNDLFAGDITEADFIGSLTTWQGRLMTSDTLAAQAQNNTEEQFALGSFKDEFMDVVIEAQDAQNSIAEQMLKDERIMGVMQKMLAKMVWKQFQQAAGAAR